MASKSLTPSSILSSIKVPFRGESSPQARSKERFEKHAQPQKDGEMALTESSFVDAITPEGEDYHKIKREQYAILFCVADRRRRGSVNFQDWMAFENLLAKPDAEYDIAFRLFDTEGTGSVSYDTFQQIFSGRDGGIPFNWNSDWATLYVGASKSRHGLDYTQFTQMLRGLTGERVRQAFHYFDKNNDGFIQPDEFQQIVMETGKHKLSDHLLENLHTIGNVTRSTKITYSDVRAFYNIVREMDMVGVIVRNATGRSKDGKITKEEFMEEAARVTSFSLFTPHEVNILFHFAGLDAHGGRLSYADFQRVLDPSWRDSFRIAEEAAARAAELARAAAEKTTDYLAELLEGLYHFTMGAVAGAFGATIVYPIDLVKTRMQNQRSSVVGHLMYLNSLDCAKKVVRNEGPVGLYRGLLPQLVGVAPEKAIKLTVNDFIRGKAPKREDGSIGYPWEVLAGGMAGGCQVIFTNPLEIVKIRLQVQGELVKAGVESAKRHTALDIVRALGVLGLYKGASACLLRDIPFSAIYFPAYAHIKKDYFKESPTNRLGVGQLLIAGAVAGMPAAYFTTPADVIKTRLQVEARKGQTHYRNISHATATIWKEEGMRAFFKGGPARIMRSSPQFGCTLAAYEFLQRMLPMPGHGEKFEKTGTVEERTSSVPMQYLRSRNALKIVLDLDENIGARYLIPYRQKISAGSQVGG